MTKRVMVLWRDPEDLTSEEKSKLRHELGADIVFTRKDPKTPEEHIVNCEQAMPDAVILPEHGFFPRTLLKKTPHVVMQDARRGTRKLFRITDVSYTFALGAALKQEYFPKEASYAYRKD